MTMIRLPGGQNEPFRRRTDMKQSTKPGTKAPNQKRRHVRLDIFSPVGFHVLVIEKDMRIRSHPAKKAGILLNLSGGGALISSTDQVETNDLLLMKFDIKGMESMSDVLGKVKRVEKCEDGELLIGIEFVTRDQIGDPVLAEGLSRLAGDPLTFTDSLKRLVSRFVFQRQIDTETGAQ
jgi:hypothetical protein